MSTAGQSLAEEVPVQRIFERKLVRCLVLAALLSGLLLLIIVCAWQSDDAYITFRTMRNVLAGRGLTWNPHARVQCFTHPLWLMILLPWCGLSGEVYFTVLTVSILLALASALLLVRLAGARLALAGLSILLLSVSGAFVDYATSGLENPLLCLLLGLLLGASRVRADHRRLVLMSLVAGLAVLARPDAGIFAAPLLALSFWQYRPRLRATRLVLLGLSPLLAWELFSLVYYGSFIPNTALAKLNLAVPTSWLLHQGALYLLDSLAHDPVTLGAVGAALALSLWKGSAHERALAMGILLYVAYVVRIGGDFMSGRFLCAPFFLSVALLVAKLADSPPRPSRQRYLGLALVAALILFGIAWPESRWRSRADFGVALGPAGSLHAHGIADERAYYYPSTGLLPVLAHHAELVERGLPVPPYRGAIAGARFARSGQNTALWNEAGFFAYFARPDQTVVDAWGLTDPLLARLPYRPDKRWRIGHYDRRIPAGYLDSIASGANRIADPGLAQVYDGLVHILRGSLLSGRRLREIWRFNTGYYAAALSNPGYL
jgi:arabinofuranosyltransferase